MTKMKRHNPLFKSTIVMILAGLLALPMFSLGGYFIQTTEANGLSPITEMEGTVYAVTAGNNLINFNSITPGAIIRTVAITGLPQEKRSPALIFARAPGSCMPSATPAEFTLSTLQLAL